MFKHILVATDGSALSTSAIQQGAALAHALGASLSAITVTAPFHLVSLDPTMVTDTEPAYQNEMRKRAKQYLAAVEDEAKKYGLDCQTIHRENGHAWEAIITCAEEQGCDLIVMASHGRSGLSALVVGSQTSKVLTHTNSPLLVSRPLLQVKHRTARA